MFSVMEGEDDITQMLIEAGANIHIQDKDGIYLVINN